MILLIGHGYIAGYIKKCFDEFGIVYEQQHHDEPIPKNTKFIVNAAGFTGVPNVDACEIYKDECVQGNVLFPLELEKRADAIPILHISSGCVYTGYKDGGWTEEDPPNFTFNNASFYSACKGLEQELLKPYMNKSYLFRIRMPFGPDRTPKNLLTKFETYAKLIDFENSVTQVEELARCVAHFIVTKPPYGIYNVCNPGGITGKEIVKAMKLEKEWMTEEEFNSITKAPRSNCVLSSKKLDKYFTMNPAKFAVSDTVMRYK